MASSIRILMHRNTSTIILSRMTLFSSTGWTVLNQSTRTPKESNESTQKKKHWVVIKASERIVLYGVVTSWAPSIGGDSLLRFLNHLLGKALVYNRSVYHTNLGAPGNIGMTPKSKVQIPMMMPMPQRTGRNVSQ